MQTQKWIEYIYSFKVRFSDTDAYGVVHHSRYYCYFEEARYEFTNQYLNLFKGYPDANDLKFPVLSSSCEYRHALTYNLEDFYVKLKFRILDDCKIAFLYEIRKEGERRVYAKGTTVHAILEHDKLCLKIPECINEVVRGSLENE